MVSRVDEYSSSYNQLNRVNTSAGRHTADSFEIDLSKESSSENLRAKESGISKDLGGGVRLDLSGDAVKVLNEKDKLLVDNEVNAKSSSSFKDIINSIIAPIKDFFLKLWYEEEPVSTENENEQFDTFSDTKDEEIRKSWNNKDLDSVINLLTDNGAKIPARSTNLLTYYDKNGKIVDINPSDKARILDGR